MQTLTGKKRTFLIVAIAVLLVVITLFSLVVYRNEYETCVERTGISLLGYEKDAINNLVRKYGFYNEVVELLKNLKYSRMQILLSMLLNMTDDSVGKLAQNSYSTDWSYYYLDSQFNVEYTPATVSLELSKEELVQLSQNGRYDCGNRIYAMRKEDTHYHLISYDVDLSDADSFDYELIKVVPYILWNNNTGTILNYNQTLPEGITENTPYTDLKTQNAFEKDGIQILRFDAGGKSYLASSKTLTDEENSVTILVYTDFQPFIDSANFSAVSFAISCILFVTVFAMLYIRLNKKRYSQNANSQEIQPCHSSSFRKQVRGACGVTIVAFLVVFTILFSLHNLVQINEFVHVAIENLYLLDEGHQQNQQHISEIAEKSCLQYADDIVEALKYDFVDLDEQLHEIADIMQVDSITMFDGNGIIENSTEPYKGYSLSKDENDPEYALWAILNGDTKQLIYSASEENKIYVAKRRTDKVGILLISISDEYVKTLSEEVEFSDLISVSSFSKADMLYANREDTKKLYIVKYGSETKRTVVNNLPVPEDGKYVIGFQNIDGDHFLYVDIGKADWVSIVAYPVSDLLKEAAAFFLFSAALFLILSFITCFSLRRTFLADLPEDAGATYEEFTNAKNKSLGIVLSTLSIFSFVSVVSGNFVSTDIPIADFFSSLEKGFNFISVFAIIVYAIFFSGLLILISLLNSGAEKVLTPKGVTISALVFTVLKLALLATFAVLVLERLGVNTIAIASSLGLAGLSLSMGSKDLVSDFMAGVCLAFEGQLQVGDYVSINGFEGVITSMGVRTTKIRHSNKEMIVNNTNMKNAINFSRGESSFTVSITLPFDTDVDALKQLIADSKQRFADVCGEKMQGDFAFQGVAAFTDFGLQCSFLGKAAPLNAPTCTRLCNTELIKLLQENSINPVRCFR